MNDTMRLQKYISMSGTASRRKAEILISEGRVSINGSVVTRPGTMVGTGDIVAVNGTRIHISKKKIYVLLNKPEGYVTTADDDLGRRIVTDLVSGLGTRVVPVGRLDYNSTGLLILSNDGDFIHRMTHPSSGVEKEYLVRIGGSLTDEHFDIIKNGIEIEGYMARPKAISLINKSSKNTYVSIILTEGRNREIRRIFEKLGYSVQKLKRIRISNIKMGSLRKGQFRYLTQEEIRSLKNSIGLSV